MVSAYPDTNTDVNRDAAAEYDADRHTYADAHQHVDTDADPNANADRLAHGITNGITDGNRDDAAHGVSNSNSNISAIRDADGRHADADVDTGADSYLDRYA